MADAVARPLWQEPAQPAHAIGAYPRWVRVELVREARAGAYRTGTLRAPDDAALILEPLLRREPTETFVPEFRQGAVKCLEQAAF